MGLKTTWHFVIFHAMLDVDEAKKIREQLREMGLKGVLDSDILPVHSTIQEANTLSKKSCIVFFLVTDNIATDREMLRIKNEHISSSFHRTRGRSTFIALFLEDKKKLKHRDNPVFAGLMSGTGLNVNSRYFNKKIDDLKTKEIMLRKPLADDNEHYERDGLEEKARPQTLQADEGSQSQNVEKETESSETVGEETVVQDSSQNSAELGPSTKPDVKNEETSKNSHEDFLYKPGLNGMRSQVSECAAESFPSGNIEKRKYSEAIESADEGSEMLMEMTPKKKRLGKERTTNQEVLDQMKIRNPDSVANLFSTGVIENKEDTVDSESANEDNFANLHDIAWMAPMISSAKHEHSEAHSLATVLRETVCRQPRTRHG